LVDARTGKVAKTVATPGHSPMVTMTADGSLLATWNAKDRAIHLWSTGTGQSRGVLLMPAPKDRFEEAALDTIRSLALTRDGAYAVCSTADRRLRVWNVATKTVIASYGLDHGGPVAISADGHRLAVADGSTIKLWPLPPK
jgi:WD40 repeat protein